MGKGLMSALNPVSGVADAIGGVANIAGSLIGGKARRKEAKIAAAQFEVQRQRLMDTNFTNPFANLENTAEDLTVNTQAAEFQAMNADQALAASLETMRATGGGASSAQAIANAALMSQQGISSSLAKQEQSNSMLRAQQAAQNQNLEAQGEEDLQTQNYNKNQDLLRMASARKQQADAARAKATQQLMGGIGQIAGGFGGTKEE